MKRAAQVAADVGTTSLSTGTAFVGALAPALAAGTAIPVAGWIVAGLGALAAAVAGIVDAVRRAKVRRQEAVAWAQQVGLPDADQVPGYIVRLQQMDPTQRAREGQRLTAVVDRRGLGWKQAAVKRGILATLVRAEAAATSPQAALLPVLPLAAAEPARQATVPAVAEYGTSAASIDQDRWAAAASASLVAVAVTYYMVRRRR